MTIELLLTEEQAWSLLNRAKRNQLTVSEHVVVIDQQVAEWEHERRLENAKSLGEMRGSMRSGCSDIAEKHDQYFAEAIIPTDTPGEEQDDDTDGPDEVG